ncbi:amidohydrolase [Namhaeicola litoreus]|uniref:Amidohydrolase n=1 Tax=Namhaeicola litoreus TaxID=1052145 RepID=A0ABW3XYV3_9FLAO
MRNFFIFCSLILFYSCSDSKATAELIVINGNIYTVDEEFGKAQAFAVSNGKFLAVGTNEEITNQYKSDQTIDAKNQTIVPGLIDAHCHFFNYGFVLQELDLVGTKSYKEIVQKIVDFQKEKNRPFILGRGWDQNDWEIKDFPTKDTLDLLFPDTPIALGRIDGHALLVNQKVLDLAGINEKTKVEGGEIIKQNGKITGVLVDNAEELVNKIIPRSTKENAINALLDAQKVCFSLGLTTVDDAGLSKFAINLIDSLQQAQKLKMRVYAMVSVSDENLDHFINNGIIKTDRLNVRSFKVYSDGALGSRGAAMRAPYSDRENHFGALVTGVEKTKEIAQRIANSDYQMNTHAIGDSANTFLLKTYQKVLKGKVDRRWRIEHAQIVSPEDFEFYKEIIPSVQPTHATSDMYWAEDRVGSDRIKGAYAYKNLLNEYGKIALGTDFPVEQVNPMLTFYAAVSRKDLQGFPEYGFNPENALSREETLKGMTIWAAYSNFEENEKGSIENGKLADFVILDQDIMTEDIHKIPETKVLSTFVNGERVYDIMK